MSVAGPPKCAQLQAASAGSAAAPAASVGAVNRPVLAVLTINFIGDGLRDALDPRRVL